MTARTETADTIPASARAVLNSLDALDLDYKLHSHAPVFTVADAQSLRGQIDGGHCKNLFLKDRKNNLFLVSTMEEARIDLKTLHTRIGAKSRLSFGSADLLSEILGVEPGAVSPLGVINDQKQLCNIVIDEAFLDFDLMNFHPLDNRFTISLSPRALLTLLASTGHTVQILSFSND